MKLPGVSIVVCCYNSKGRLSQTLNHLALQKVPDCIKWEVVLVDNNSTDNTSTVAENEWKKYSVNAPLTVVKQPVPGLNAAREKGFETAKYEYIICCDDDNWLSSNYVKEVVLIFDNHPDVGVIGTKAIPHYEEQPPEWFEKYNVWFALGTQGKPGDITNEKGYVWGAGMALRHTALTEVKKSSYKNLLTDRVGGKMTTGGDVEICFALRLLNYNIFYTDACYLKHYMPKDRFCEAKFFKLAFQNGYSNAYLFCMYNKYFPSRAELVKTIADIIRRMPKRNFVKYLLKKNDFEGTKTLNDWYGFLQGHLFLFKNQNRVDNNFSTLTSHTDSSPVNKFYHNKRLVNY
jgi:glycosyltransferase involved in cell wall biosynthesis